MTIHITQQGSQIVIMMETKAFLTIVGQLIRLTLGHPSKPAGNTTNDEDEEEQVWRWKILTYAVVIEIVPFCRHTLS